MFWIEGNVVLSVAYQGEEKSIIFFEFLNRKCNTHAMFSVAHPMPSFQLPFLPFTETLFRVLYMVVAYLKN